MDANQLQLEFFNHLKSSLPPHISIADELCDLLNISADSAYRRIRGEKPLTLAELKIVCQKFHLSIDHLLHLEDESVLFQAPGLNGVSEGLTEYLKGMLRQFKYFNSFNVREMHYLCKDITFWYFYLFPEMSAFKSFFWTKNIHNDPELVHKKFSLNEYPFRDCFEIGQQILQEYNKMPSVEIWNLESIHSTINQVSYYKYAGIFKTQEDIDAVIESFHRMLNHLEAQAEKGVKFLPGATDLGYRAPIQYYVNELILGNNTMLLTLNDKRLSVVTHSVLSYLMTTDKRFADKTLATFNALSSSSTLISKTGEKDRNRFFNSMHDKVDALKK